MTAIERLAAMRARCEAATPGPWREGTLNVWNDDMPWTCAQDMWDWWLSDASTKTDDDQMTFETVTDGVFV